MTATWPSVRQATVSKGWVRSAKLAMGRPFRAGMLSRPASRSTLTRREACHGRRPGEQGNPPGGPMPEFRTVDTGEVKLRCAIEGEGPLVVMVHGFPESWYSWRHQIGPIAEAGFTACAIDVRGYGGSDKPEPIEAYAMEHMTADVAGLAQALQPDSPAILIGHDWGAPIVWNTALTRPERIAAVAGLSVAYTGVPARPFTEVFNALYTAKN